MSLKKIYLTARTEYAKWVFNPRMIIIGVMIIFVYQLSVQPLVEMANEMKSTLNFLEPYIAITNSSLLIIIIPGVFLTLVSDFPKTDGSTLLFLQRTDRMNWVLGQALFIVFAIITFMVIIIVASILPILGISNFDNNWSDTVLNYKEKFPEKAMSFGANLITKNLTYQIPPIMAFVESTTLLMLYLFMLSLIMLVFNTMGIKIMGLVTSAGIIAIGAALCMINTSIKWIMPMAHTVVWLHKTDYFRAQIMEIWKSYAYFGIIILILMLFSCMFIDSTDFDSVSDID